MFFSIPWLRIILLTSVGACTWAAGATFNLSEVSVDTGSLSPAGGTLNASATGESTTISITNVDADGDGTATDSFDVILSHAGAVWDGAGRYETASGGQITAGDNVTLSLSLANIITSDGQNDLQINELGFTAFKLTRFQGSNGETVIVSDSDHNDGTFSQSSINFTSPSEPTFSITSGPTGSWNIDHFDVLVDVRSVGDSGGNPIPTGQAIGFYSGALTPDEQSPELKGVLTLNGTAAVSTGIGSTDGTSGSFATNTPITGGAWTLANGDTISLTVTNQFSGRARLTDLNLDFAPRSADGPQNLTVSYSSGDLSDPTTELDSLRDQTAVNADLADFADLDIELRAFLLDATLDQGESATFTFAADNATGTGLSAIDNLRISAVMTSYAAPPPADRPAISSPRLPNVVVFYADDVGLGDISSYGFPTTRMSTPNIDALAATGMTFTNAHTTSGLCAPSRYGVLCGSLPLRGLKFSGQFSASGPSQVLDGQKTTADLFKAAGYRTGFIGKVHLGGTFDLHPTQGWLRGWEKSVNQLGFDYSFLSHDGIQASPYIYFENNEPVGTATYDEVNHQWSWTIATDGTGEYRFEQITTPPGPGQTDEGVGYIETDRDGDGFLGQFKDLSSAGSGSFNTNVRGRSYWDSTRTGEMYSQAALNFLDDYVANHSDTPFYMHYACQAVHIPHSPGGTFFGEPVGDVYKRDWNNNGVIEDDEAAPHLDMLHEMDLQVKMLIDKLSAEGLLENTLFIFTSDNGGLSSSKRVTGHETSGIYSGKKGSVNEGGHRVPFIARWGDGSEASSVIPPGTVCEQLISQTDLFATFATLLNQPQPTEQGRDGVNILPYFQGRFTPTLRDQVVMTAQGRFAFHSGDWKYIPNADKDQDNRIFTPIDADVMDGNKLRILQLYHLASDPAESNNLVDDPRYDAIQARLLADLTERISSGRSTPALDADNDGLFDSWEQETAGDLTTFDDALLNSTVDSDGDGISDQEEYILRSNPQSPDLEFKQISVALDNTGDNAMITWQSREGVTYQVSESETLIESSWAPVTGIFLGTGSEMSVALPFSTQAGDTKKFYRLEIE